MHAILCVYMVLQQTLNGDNDHLVFRSIFAIRLSFKVNEAMEIPYSKIIESSTPNVLNANDPISTPQVKNIENLNNVISSSRSQRRMD